MPVIFSKKNAADPGYDVTSTVALCRRHVISRYAEPIRARCKSLHSSEGLDSAFRHGMAQEQHMMRPIFPLHRCRSKGFGLLDCSSSSSRRNHAAPPPGKGRSEYYTRSGNLVSKITLGTTFCVSERRNESAGEHGRPRAFFLSELLGRPLVQRHTNRSWTSSLCSTLGIDTPSEAKPCLRRKDEIRMQPVKGCRTKRHF